ncbi:MAG: hypothetical protein AAF468_13370 [Pseudomonadota bacterium]
MKNAALTIISVALVSTFASQAMARPNTANMLCHQARALVKDASPILLNVGPRQFRRFVVHKYQCATGEYAYNFFGLTRDNPKCLIGRICRPGRAFDN